MKERGSALLTAVIIVMLLLSISGIFLTTVIYQAKNESSEEKGLRAYYLAEAGVQYGIGAGIQALEDSNLEEGEVPANLLLELDDPFDQGGKIKKVTVVFGVSSFKVTSIGDYFKTIRTIEAEYAYGEEDSSSGGGGDGDGGSDNDCEDDVVLPSDPWVNGKYYEKGSKVSYEGRAFYARENNTSQIPGIPGNYWQEITKKWTDFNWYTKHNIVCFGGKKYIARDEMQTPSLSNVNTPGEVKSGNYWQELTHQWRIFNSYSKGDIVYYDYDNDGDDELFLARENMMNPVSHENVPGEVKVGNYWQEITSEWRVFNSYSKGDIVYYDYDNDGDDELFLARENMMNPVSDENVPGEVNSGNYWQELTSEWTEFNSYSKGDIVYYEGNLFKARENMMNPVGKVPGKVESGNYWEQTTSPVPAPVLMATLVTPIDPDIPASIKVDQTKVAFTAIAVYSDGSTTDVRNAAKWGSSHGNIATMTDGGVATALATDFVNGKLPMPINTPVKISVPISIPITASFESKKGTEYLTVTVPTNTTPPPPPGTGTGQLLWEKEIIR